MKRDFDILRSGLPRTGFVISLLALCAFFTATALPESEIHSKKALVMGNARYERDVGRLQNPDKDARAVAKTLRELGFLVTEKHDLSRDEFISAIEGFRRSLSGVEVALLYYAGHGISINGSNYLVPVNSGFRPEGADPITLRMLAETRLFNAEQAIADMTSGQARCNLIILDACRNTPIAKTRANRSIMEGGGLSEMKPPAGSLIAFSTDAGQVALDGDGENGLYTGELLKHLRIPGYTIEQVFKKTRASVMELSGGNQIPAEYSRLIGDDVFLAGRRTEPEAESSVDAFPEPENLARWAMDGRINDCVRGLEILANSNGPGEYALAPLEALLERAKVDLQDANKATNRAADAERICTSVKKLLQSCLPQNHPRFNEIASKASNRRGDALIYLGKPEAALEEFLAAEALAPRDAYVYYNRGRAYLALGNEEAARKDFQAAANPSLNQPKARALALNQLKNLIKP